MANIYKPTSPENKEENLHRGIKLPRDKYAVRIKEEKFETSKSSQQPMIVLVGEIVAPDSIKLYNGTTVNIGGAELKKMYLSLRAKDEETGEIDLKKSQSLFDRYADLRNKCQVPIPEEGVDIENPPKSLEGLVVDAICDGEEFAMRKDPTPEQRAKREMGEIIKDSNGNPIISYTPYIVQILGLADPEVAQKATAKRPF